MSKNVENDRLGEMISRIANMGTWRVDIKKNTVWWSPTTKEIHEVPEDFVPNLETGIEFYIEEHRPIITRLVENAIEHKSSWDVNLQILTAKKNKKWVRAIGYPVYEGDDLIALEGVFQDVDEIISVRRVAEEYQEAIDSLSDIMVSKQFYDMDKVFYDALAIGLDYLGFDIGIISLINEDKYQVVQSNASSKEMIVEKGTEFELGNTYCSLVVKTNSEVFIDHMGESEFKGHPAYAAFKLESYIGIPLRVKGLFFGTLNFSSLNQHQIQKSNLHQKFAKFLGTWVEMIIERNDLITEYARNFELAKESQALFEAVFNDVPSALVLTDSDRQIISVNRNFLDLFGYKLEEIKSQPARSLLFEESKVFDEELFLNSGSDEKLMAHDIAYVDHKGDKFIGETVGAPITDEEGKFLGHLRVIRDRTEEIRTANLLNKQNTELEKERTLSFQNSKMAALGQMAGGVAHEINNPLTIIEGFSKNLARKLEKGADVDSNTILRTMGKITNASQRISKIVQGLKSFARDDSFDDIKTVSVLDMINETLSFCEQRFTNNGVELKLDEIDDAWAFTGHSVQISQVILNLLNNSFDAIIDNQDIADRWIKLMVEVSNGRVHFRVLDSGKGILDKNVATLMLPFFTTKDVGKGTGLGLSISQGIVEKHGGKLEYELYNGNTSFKFSMKAV